MTLGSKSSTPISFKMASTTAASLGPTPIPGSAIAAGRGGEAKERERKRENEGTYTKNISERRWTFITYRVCISQQTGSASLLVLDC